MIKVDPILPNFEPQPEKAPAIVNGALVKPGQSKVLEMIRQEDEVLRKARAKYKRQLQNAECAEDGSFYAFDFSGDDSDL